MFGYFVLRNKLTSVGMDTVKKMVSLKECVIFLVLTKILDPQNFTFASKNGWKQPNEWISGNKNCKKLLGRCQRPLW